MVEGGMKCIKFLLFSFNFIFVIIGIGLIVSGAVVLTVFKDYTTFLGDQYYGPAVFLIVVGVIIFAIASFGCCGAARENYHCVMAFAVLLGLIFIFEIAAGIAGFVMRNEIESYVTDQMTKSEKEYSTNSDFKKAWDDVQDEYTCCGVNNYTEWYQYLNGTTSVPDSCCITKTAGCGTSAVPGNVKTEGCSDSFIQKMKNNIYIIGAVGIGLAFIQIVGVTFACCLARAIRKEYEVV